MADVHSKWKVSREYSFNEFLEIILNETTSLARLDIFASFLQKLSAKNGALGADVQNLLYACADYNFAAGVCLIYDAQGTCAAKAHYLKQYLLNHNSGHGKMVISLIGMRDTSLKSDGSGDCVK